MADKVVLPLLLVRILGRSKRQKIESGLAPEKNRCFPFSASSRKSRRVFLQPSVEKQFQGGVNTQSKHLTRVRVYL
ncbi:Histone H4 [Podospora pseudopauciseta]|uniref:Histone H4 n=2 Tax=Podospora TaxID=5144 RepID=A0ABR0H3P5_9PEZI|nr:Histone H4 [Podospora pseudopauciseta]KAK4670964.1 Histone H4 [Podospora pseudoanserina]